MSVLQLDTLFLIQFLLYYTPWTRWKNLACPLRRLKMADCCIFAGQGAQVPGMGKDFAEADPEIMGFFDKANAVLGFDLKKICFEGPAEELTRSNVCQPAIFVTSYAAYTALRKRKAVDFACAAGLSLGEWGALCAAGVLDFDSTLKVLEARGRFMQEACEATPSGMIAVVAAAAIASFEPDNTCCAAELTLATVQPVFSQSAFSWSGVAPTMAIIPDGVASQASCMKRPRASSTFRVESKSRTPAAHRAPHSPRDRPAAQAKSTFFFFLSAEYAA